MDKKRSIGFAAKEIGVPEHTIRYWGQQFPAFETKNIGKNNRRYYLDKDIDNFLKLKYFLHEKKFSIGGLKILLQDNKNLFKKNLDELKKISLSDLSDKTDITPEKEIDFEMLSNLMRVQDELRNLCLKVDTYMD
ncbi:MAG: MerR family transcriptional regulator [Rickettsiales bacterium]|jgi:DNA-binding transcriptional MerR regulator|nr:MerR family transcriptional regulator [Rickettsiales bacterium]